MAKVKFGPGREQKKTELILKSVLPIAIAEQQSLLDEHGIVVHGTKIALAEVGKMLADMPAGEALVYIAEQGRKHGVRFYATPKFNLHLFIKDAERFRMNIQQAQRFSANLYPID